MISWCYFEDTSKWELVTSISVFSSKDFDARMKYSQSYRRGVLVDPILEFNKGGKGIIGEIDKGTFSTYHIVNIEYNWLSTSHICWQ